MLSSALSLLNILFPSRPVPLLILFVSRIPSCSITFFSSLTRSRYLFFIFFHPKVRRQSLAFGRFSISKLTITRSGRLAEIKRFVCISKSQIILCILQDGFLVAPILVRIVKFKFLALFPADHLPQFVMSSHIFFLSYFAAFTYLINCVFCITT